MTPFFGSGLLSSEIVDSMESLFLRKFVAFRPISSSDEIPVSFENAALT
jgi:hypothetical protein